MKSLLCWSMLAMSITFTSITLAEDLGAEDIKFTHEQVQQSFNQQCMKKIHGATQELCACLAEKAESNLDDDALANCANDESGDACVTLIVDEATQKTLTEENINACNAKSARIAPGLAG